MEIRSASFILSSSSTEQCPKGSKPEFAFIGRSNVGKSSLINMLTHQRNLAKTSGKPGKTQLINHFLINDEWFLVDLPGYGYAKTSKKNRKAFRRLITQYFQKRLQLVTTFVLVDSRHEPQKIDLEFMQWLGEQAIPFSIVFTKIDKLKPCSQKSNIALYKNKLQQFWEPLPQIFLTSSAKRIGGGELSGYIEDILTSL